LKELARQVAQSDRPSWWPALWERYVESRLDFRAEPKVLAEKFQQTGQHGAKVFAWCKGLKPAPDGRKVRLLARVWEEEFEWVPPSVAAQPSASAPSGDQRAGDQPGGGGVRSGRARGPGRGAAAQRRSLSGYGHARPRFHCGRGAGAGCRARAFAPNLPGAAQPGPTASHSEPLAGYPEPHRHPRALSATQGPRSRRRGASSL